MKPILAALFFTFFSLAISAQSWSFSYVDLGAKPTLAVFDSQTVHMAYMYEVTSGWLNHAELSPSGWDISTVDEGYYYGPLDIGLKSDETPVIALHDHTAEDQVIYQRLGDEWTEEFTPHPNHDGWDNSLHITQNDELYLVSTDPSSQNGVEYHYQTDGDWITERLVGAGNVFYGNGTALVMRGDTMPLVAFYRNSEQELVYAEQHGFDWEVEIVETGGDVGRFPSLVERSDGTLFLSYIESANEKHYVKLAQKNSQDAEWSISIIDSLDYMSFGSRGARDPLELQLDPEENLHICYTDAKIMKCGYMTGSTWIIDEVLNFESDTINMGQQLSFKIDSAGGQHLSYYRLRQTTPVFGEIYYGYRPEPEIMPAPTRRMSGRVTCPSGSGAAGVELVILSASGARLDTTFTDSDGFYVFENLPVEESYFLGLRKVVNPLEAVTASDLVTLRRYLLGVDIGNNEWFHCTADYSGNDELSTLDIVRILKGLLGLGELQDMMNFFSETSEDLGGKEAFIIDAPQDDSPIVENFLAVTPGDVNGSYCPE